MEARYRKILARIQKTRLGSKNSTWTLEIYIWFNAAKFWQSSVKAPELSPNRWRLHDPHCMKNSCMTHNNNPTCQSHKIWTDLDAISRHSGSFGQIWRDSKQFRWRQENLSLDHEKLTSSWKITWKYKNLRLTTRYWAEEKSTESRNPSPDLRLEAKTRAWNWKNRASPNKFTPTLE